MTYALHCSKCHEKTKELYSPDWTCAKCTSPEIRKLYKDWHPEKQEKGKTVNA